MDFPHAQMQAALAATNFSPAEVPSLYVQPDNSQRNAHRKESVIQPLRKSDTGGHRDQRQASRKSSIRKFGSLFGRDRGIRNSIASSGLLTTVGNSERADDNTNIETKRSVQLVTRTDSTETDSSMSSMNREEIREHHRKFVKLQRLGTDDTTILTADPDDYSQYNYDDTVDNQRSRAECQNCEGTHVAHDLAPTPPGSRHRHQRRESLRVNLTPEDVERFAGEVRNMTIADVHLSLFGYWIKESDENFREAKKHLRELGVDRGYNLSRLNNYCLEELCRDVLDIRPTECRTTVLKQQPATEKASLQYLTPTRSFSLPVAPRIDTLPPSLREQRERVISEAAQRSTSLGSPDGPRDYPPNTPDRPLPLSPRSPSSTLNAPPLPLGFPSPCSPPRASDDHSILESYRGSSDSSLDGVSDWDLRVADIYEQVVSLEDITQIDRIIADLQNLKDLYSSREIEI
ncbi:uncharacterized protein ALTATR162_LOCUS7309 [Alternaria atra]|uniref:Uncharacterized protein n=1 Tax=Alternaria atra TaxID=119953 RepID=A0A8J2I438_9PLEO|nr:uncharacterized protein ALTATR162_LOCUS7309 [Alternaria atra]CAG5171329.1 unnamed protein product [Alternaria atra]